jgi:molybdopterin-guanine dinucleotide biosynthesis protein A
MSNAISGVILAGGLNKRFDGKVKGLLPLGKKRIIERIIDVFTPLFDEVILVTNNPLNFLEYDLFMGADLFSFRSSLTGIHAGLFYCNNPYAFIVASDAPFLNPGLVKLLLSKIRPGYDVIIPETSAGFEPLCAVYSKNCLKAVETHLHCDDFRIRSFYKKVKVKTVLESDLKERDPNLYSFFNVNTPEDLKQAEAMLNKIKSGENGEYETLDRQNQESS